MQYSYESWPATHSNSQMNDAAFSPSDDLYALEESLTMNWDEVIEQSQQKQIAPESQLNFQVEEYMHTQLEKLWKVADTHYQDNKMLATQVQTLLNEREQLRAALHAYELEVSRYQHLFGNMYLKH